MEVIFQVLDVDYIPLNGSPLVRIFGKTRKGKTICVFSKGLNPYFYILPKKGRENKVIKYLQENFKNLLVDIRKEFKFKPIGFSEERTEMLKIILTNPAKVPEVRDRLLENSDIEEIYEADILFKYRFMVDCGVSGMKWYKVYGESTHTTTVKTDVKVEMEKIEEVDEMQTQLKYLSFDIEVASGGIPDPKKHPIAIISITFEPKYKNKKNLLLVSKPVKKYNDEIISFTDEKEMLDYFVKIIDEYDPDILVGYNINNFDFPYLLERLRANKLPTTLGRAKDKKATSRKIGNKYRNSVVGRIIVDVYELVREAVSKGLLRLKRYGLGDVSHELLGEGKVDVTHSEITKFWNGSEDEMKKLLEYAKKDSLLTLRLLLEKNMLDKFIELSKVSGLLLQDVLDSGESSRIENLLLREFNRSGFVLPLKPTRKEVLKRKEERETKGLKGALVLDPKTGLHTKGIVYLDFKAMYPSIFISFNICPTTLLLKDENVEHIETPYGTKFVSKKVREGIIPKILRVLIQERDEIKKELKKTKNEEKRRQLNAKQYALKIMANAFYGYTGYLRARLYILDIANAITSCGRYLIKKTKEIVEEDPRFSVVYGDTDSVFVKVPAHDIEEAFELGKMLEKKINRELKGIVKMKIESVFQSLLILAKKRYAGLALEKVGGEWKEKMIMKGIETVRRDWCELTEKTLYTTLEILLKEGNITKAFNYVKEVLEKLEKNQIPLKDLVITKTLSKSLTEYKGIQPHVELLKKLKRRSPEKVPGIGDRIGFVIVQGPELVSKRAEDPDYVMEKGLKIDSKYYIESQLLPPLERVFDVIGIKKSQLVGMGKQLLIKDIIKKSETVNDTISEFEGFACSKCGMIYRRIPLKGKCDSCNAPIYFYSKGKLGKSLLLQPLT